MDYRILMELASELGTRLAVAGAETYRVEESIVRVLAAYGLDSRVYSVPNSLFITIMVPDMIAPDDFAKENAALICKDLFEVRDKLAAGAVG